MSCEYTKLGPDLLEETDTSVRIRTMSRASITARRADLVTELDNIQEQIDDCDAQILILDG